MPTVTFRETAGQSNGHADKFANRYKAYGHPTDAKHITAGQSNGHPNGHLRTRPQRTRPPLLIGRSGPGLTPEHPSEIRSPYRLDRSRIVSDVTERSPEQKAEALAIYAVSGLAEAHRQTGVPKPTLHRWANDAGLDVAAISIAHVEQTAAATEARIARCDAKRAEIRERILDAAGTMLDRIDLPHKEFRGNLATEVNYDTAPADACRSYATAFGILLDKYRLEVGEATLVHAVAGDPSEVESMRDELSKRRLERAS